MQIPKKLDSELAASTSATPVDVTDVEAHARLSSAALAMCAAVDCVARGERDEAVSRLSSAMHETASALREQGLDLHEVLPHEVCAGCGRQTVEFRRVRGAVECSFCTAESGSAHDSCDQPGCESYLNVRQQERHVRVEVRGHGPSAQPAVTLLSPESARMLAHRLHLVGLACEGHDVQPPLGGRATLIEMRTEDSGRKVRIRMSGGTPMPFDTTFATNDAEAFARTVLEVVAKARREQVLQ